MRRSSIFGVFGLILLVVLAGCGMFSPTQVDDRTNAEKIESSMDNVETVETYTSTVKRITIQNSNTTVNQTTRQRSRIQYNFKNNSYVMAGVGSQSLFGKTTQYQFERYYVNGTMYERRATSTMNSTPEWQSATVNQDARTNFAILANSSFLSKFNATTKSNVSNMNGTVLVYQIDLLNQSTHIEQTLNSSLTSISRFEPLLDTYVVEMYVDADTYRLKEVRIFASASLNNSELSKIDDVYDNPKYASTRGELFYLTQINYEAYNESVKITVPDEAQQ